LTYHQEASVFRKLAIWALSAGVVLCSTAAFAQGTAADANAMLEKTVAAIKAGQDKALDEINAQSNGFLVGDIFPVCWSLSDGKLLASGNNNDKGILGKDVRTFKDPTNGDPVGQRLFDAAKLGQVNEIRHQGSKPGPDKTRVPKVSFVTAVEGVGCSAGYYPQ
jgi:hypothetical protein